MASSSTTSIPAIDDPYFIDPSYTPGVILVSQRLTGGNYSSWRTAMVSALAARNKLGFIDGTLKKPDGEDEGLRSAWIYNNRLLVFWILNTVSEEIATKIMFIDSAYEIWEDLSRRFQQQIDCLRLFNIKRDMVKLSQKEDSVSVYFTKFECLRNGLVQFRPCSCKKCDCGGMEDMEKFFQMDQVMTFLMGLNDSFSHIREQILLKNPIPEINTVFSLVKQEEKNVASLPQSSTAFRGNSNVNPGYQSNTAAFKGNRGYQTDTAAFKGNRGYQTDAAAFKGNRGYQTDTAAFRGNRGYQTDTAAFRGNQGYQTDTAAFRGNQGYHHNRFGAGGCFRPNGGYTKDKQKQAKQKSVEPEANATALNDLIKSLSAAQCQELISAISTHVCSGAGGERVQGK